MFKNHITSKGDCDQEKKERDGWARREIKKGPEPVEDGNRPNINSGSVLLSHNLAVAVSSALEGL
ncbi:MAG: hypothetical protein ACYCT9_09540, partial [Leptospirillum sp.]